MQIESLNVFCAKTNNGNVNNNVSNIFFIAVKFGILYLS